MKTAHSVVMGVVVLLAVACGKTPLAQTSSSGGHGVSVAPQPTGAGTAGAGLTLPVDASCPLYFPKAGLCASTEWKTAPSADIAGEVEIRFWNMNSGTRAAGPYVIPAIEPKSFFVMKCCKTPSRCPLTKSAEGTYSASGLNLVPGDYLHYVLVGAEKASLDVTVK
jgi:hypothetical protein